MINMEDIWKKFKQETEKDMSKIKNFLDEISFGETNPKEIHKKKAATHLDSEKKKPAAKITKPMVSRKKSHDKKDTPRKKIYGKLSDLVREIMEKENLSRAQAYRVAKKRFLNNF